MQYKSNRSNQQNPPGMLTDPPGGTGAGLSNSDQQSKLSVEPIDRAVTFSMPTSGDVSALGVANADVVEQGSNDDKSDKTWQYMRKNPTQGFELGRVERGTHDADVKLTMSGTTDDTRAIANAGGVDTLAEYRRMLMNDFNFQGVIGKYIGKAGTVAAGGTAFVADVVHRYYGDLAVTDPAVQPCVAIARNIWSYATTGADLHGTTDVAELQGLLYVFDQQIAASSDKNTKMQDGKDGDGNVDNTEYFVVPGTEGWDLPIKLLKGDGKHGEATILTTRHLMRSVSQDDEFDESYLLIDKSDSMQDDEYDKIAKLVEIGGIDGDIALAGFNDRNDGVLDRYKNGLPLPSDQVVRLLQNANGASTDTDLKQALVTRQGSGSTESGVTSAIAWLSEMPDPTTQGLGLRRQLLIATDATEASPERLGELQELAIRKRVTIRLLFSFRSDSMVSEQDGADQYVIIDLADVVPAELQALHGNWRQYLVNAGLQPASWE